MRSGYSRDDPQHFTMHRPANPAALLDELPQAVWLASDEGHLLWANAAWHPPLPARLHDALHANDLDTFTQSWAQATDSAKATGTGRLDLCIRLLSSGSSQAVRLQARWLNDRQQWLGTHSPTEDMYACTGPVDADTRLREADTIWKLALECSGDGVWDWHVQAGVEQFSDRYLRLYGFEPGEVEATPEAFDARTHPDDRAQMDLDRAEHFAGRTAMYSNEHRVLTKDGHWKWVLSRGMVITRDAQGRPLRMVGTHTDISARKHQEALMWQQARVDTLTGLPNRRALRERMEQALAALDAGTGQLAVMFVDLDHFKEVNDSLGHDVGDALLVQAAGRLQACLPAEGVVARMGGDEFTVLLPAKDAAALAERVSRRMLDALSMAFDVSGERIYVSASMGLSLAPADGRGIEDLFKHADQALYEAKGAGRNRLSRFRPALQQAAEQRARLTTELREAMRLRQFSLVYQPILPLQQPFSKPRKAEALLRWQHPVHGPISPALFVPAAETSGLIVELGDWVFHTAASQVRAWRAAGYPDFQISINKSPVQFRSERGAEGAAAWLAQLAELGLDGSALAIEITEGLLLEQDSAVTQQLRTLRNAGLPIVLDDFGTGYSSLGYLQQHEIDTIKIDRSFIADLANSTKARALCQAIVTMAHELGLEVVAEGVETAAQLQALQDMGCDWGQGWWFGAGIPAREFEERWLNGGSAP